jgi:hypothetical protein
MVVKALLRVEKMQETAIMVAKLKSDFQKMR